MNLAIIFSVFNILPSAARSIENRFWPSFVTPIQKFTKRYAQPCFLLPQYLPLELYVLLLIQLKVAFPLFAELVVYYCDNNLLYSLYVWAMKPFLTKNVQAQLCFAKTYIKSYKSIWGNVLQSDEIKVGLLAIIPNSMLFCFSSAGTVALVKMEGIMNSFKYQSILHKTFRPLLKR